MRIFSERTLICVLFVFALCGCRPSDPITRVVVDADSSGVVLVDESEKAKPIAGRMVVAILGSSESTWTFKVSGPIAEVNSSQSDIMAFYRGVEFVAGAPSLDELPDGWTSVEIAPGPFAPYARLQMPGGLTMSISRLPGGFDMLSNVNRWRNQLSLPPTNELELKPLEGNPKSKFEIFDAIGTLGAGGGSMSAPFAGGGANRTPPPVDSEIEYLAPPGWEVGRISQIVAARLSKSVDDAIVQITVVKLPAKLNDWSQVSRNWAGEVDLGELTDEELAERTSDITIGTLSGKGIRLIEDNEDITRALIGYRAVKDDEAWFVKISGDKKLVADHEKEFTAFAETIRFK